jgi:hypothetical protein
VSFVNTAVGADVSFGAAEIAVGVFAGVLFVMAGGITVGTVVGPGLLANKFGEAFCGMTACGEFVGLCL